MIPKPLADISAVDLQGLIDGQVREGKSIDYKQDLPGKRDRDKREFLADVTSFANASGGDIVYGATEDQGLPTGFPGVTAEDLDDEILRLENLIRTGVEPRLPDVHLRPVPMEDGKTNALLLRVGQSWNMPHRVIFQEHAKFYGRNSAGKYPLDVGELRTAFTQSDTISQKIRTFREERLLRIGANEGPAPLIEGSVLCFHLVPLSSITSPKAVDLNDYANLVQLQPLGSSGLSYRPNLDGYLNYSTTDRTTVYSYAQVFRNGAIEYAMSLIRHDDTFGLPSAAYERYLMEGLLRTSRFFEQCEILPPVYLFVSILGAQDCEFGVSRERGLIRGTVWMEHKDLILPEVVCEDLAVPPETTLRPVFDMIWNAWGYAGSMNYDDNGNWVGTGF